MANSTATLRPLGLTHMAATGAAVVLFLVVLLWASAANIGGMGRSESAAIADKCAAIGADMLVMGGYGSPRLQEMIFGGVTRGLTRSAKLPLLLSH